MYKGVEVITLKAPKGETIWATYLKKGKPAFMITSKQSRDWYYLYEINGTEITKLGKAKTPPELEEKYSIQKKLKT